MAELDRGAVEAIFNGDTSCAPRVQLLDVKLIPPKPGAPAGSGRYRLVISDGLHLMQAMLATAQNHIMESGQVKAYTVVKLQSFICNVIHNRKVIIALTLLPIMHMNTTIGQPQKLDDPGAPSDPVGPLIGHDNNGGYAAPPGQPGYSGGGQHTGYQPPQQHWQDHAVQHPPGYQQPAYQQQPSYHGAAQDPYQQHQQQQYNQQQQPYQQQPPPKRQQTSPPQYNQYQANVGANVGAPPPQLKPAYGQPDQNSWQQQPPQQYGQPQHQPYYAGQGAVQRDSNSAFTPIASLTPYVNRWKIKGRILNKNMRTYSNAKGEGKLFNLEIADQSGEIRVTGFNESHDAFYEKITVGRCYIVSGGTLKGVNKAFNKLPHPFEITLQRTCVIEECEDSQELPKQQFNFVPVGQIEMVADDTHVDVLAMISQCDDPLTYTNKKGREVTKRVLHLADASGKSIEATMFGDNAQDMRLSVGTAVAIKGAKVGSWNTKSLTLWGDCQYEVNPDTPDSHELMGWWRQAGSSMQHQHISMAGGGGGTSGRDYPRIFFSDIEERAMGMNGTPEYFSVSCFVTHIKTDQRTLWYIACPDCKKKVAGASENNLDGHCEKCDKSVKGTRRWIFSGQCNDVSGARYISFFDDTAIKLLDGKSADELGPLKEHNPVAFDGHFRKHSFQRVLMKCQVKSDTYNDEQRLKVSCQSFAPLNVIEEGSKLLHEIRQLQV